MLNERLVNRTISVLYRYNQQFFSRSLREAELPVDTGQLAPLIQAYRFPGITQDEIACAIGMDKGTTARALKVLEENGLVLRKTDENDRRINHIYPSEAALKIREKIFGIIQSLHDILYEGFDEQEIQQVIAALERMKGNITACIKTKKGGRV